ncbi:hypothetical protein N1851_007706 [Merluccius polli]|uniref:Uncharacterized protein n=1 Tax=Merluccius polli TaxID=89951 RepID=A0AA47M4W2_MERPO|nr:hypothetical protein N1851_030705 [Merluccius polli]KAK0151133.1 hypothetical protein N1851_007706 [Merluccius polli]
MGRNESLRLLLGALLSVSVGTLLLYGLLRLILPGPVPVPTTPWRGGFLDYDGANGTKANNTNATNINATCANDTQGTVHNPPLVYNPPARRRRTILPHDDPHAPRRNDSDPCLRQFDGVQITHINGTKRMYSIPLHTLFTAAIWKRPSSRWEHDNKYVCDGPIEGKPEWQKGTSRGFGLTGCRNAGHILWDTRDKRAGTGMEGSGKRAARAYTNPRARSDDTRLLQEGGKLSMEGKNVILTLTSVGAHQYQNPLCPSAPDV